LDKLLLETPILSPKRFWLRSLSNILVNGSCYEFENLPKADFLGKLTDFWSFLIEVENSEIFL
jgi:hypothetical protein